MKLLLALLLTSSWAHANSIYALQQPMGIVPSYRNSTNIQLGPGTPLLGPTLLSQHLFKGMPAYLAFATTLDAFTGREELALTIGGITYTTGSLLNFAACLQDCVDVSSFVLPRGFYHPTLATLTVGMGGESQEYSFYFVEPVPEPSTWTLITIGLAGWAWRGSRVNRRSREGRQPL